MTADQAGTLHVVWLDHRDTAGAAAGHQAAGHAHRDGVAMAQRSGLYYAQVGQNVGAERVLARGVCYCCKTAVRPGRADRIATAWRHVYPGNLRDIAAATSADSGGRTFTAPQPGQRRRLGPRRLPRKRPERVVSRRPAAPGVADGDRRAGAHRSRVLRVCAR